MAERRHVVIVEDNPDNLSVLQLLVGQEFEVSGFTSSTEVLHGIADLTPHLLLMDIGMPDIDGKECLRRIRALPGFERIPAIAVTAFAYPEDRRRCLEAGFQAVFIKPLLDHTELYAEINRLLEANAAASYQ